MTPTTIETLGPLLELEGFNVVYSSSKYNKVFRLLDMLFSIIKNRNVDAVLIDTYSTGNYWYAFASSQLCRLLKLKYIPILHGGNLAFRLQKNPIVSKMIFKHSFHNVSPSLFLKDQFSSKGFDVIYIPNAIEIIKYPFIERKKATPKLLWVRSFASIYNPVMAIEVFYKIKIKYPQATLCMVGPEKDGSLLIAKQKAKDLNVEVLFTGKLPKSSWIGLSKEYDIFLNTTHFDNMPVSIVEAMALGLVIVSTNVGGISYLIENQKEGLVVPDDDTDKMVEAIEVLLENPVLFCKLASNSKHKAEQFEWQIVKLKWITILK